LPARAIRSALGQTYRNIELLFGSEATAHVIGGDDPRVRCVTVTPHANRAALRNACLRSARGDYVVWLDGDVTLDPDFVRILLGAALEGRHASAYCAQGLAAEGGLEAVRYAVFSRALLENRPYFDLSSVLHERALLESDAPFDERAGEHADWLFLLKLTERVAARAVPCVLSLSQRRAAEAPACGAASAAAPPREASATSAVDAWLSDGRLADDLPAFAVSGLEWMHAQRHRPRPARPRPVSVVIPSYECLDHLRLCIAAVRRFTQMPFELIVVDNASSPPVQEFLAGIASPDVVVIRNARNAGFTRAVNQGIARCTPGNDVILLNNDAVVTPGWVDAMQSALEDVPTAGIVVPRQVLLPGTDTLMIHQPVCDPTREMDVNLSAHHDNILDPCLDTSAGLMELSFAPFFCAYLPRSVVDALGPLDDEGAPHYRSDRLYCEAVRRLLNRKIVYTPHAKVYHFLQRATHALAARSPAEYDAFFLRNERPEEPSPL
jgi:O-antigen biosynthesis protein